MIIKNSLCALAPSSCSQHYLSSGTKNNKTHSPLGIFVQHVKTFFFLNVLIIFLRKCRFNNTFREMEKPQDTNFFRSVKPMLTTRKDLHYFKFS